MKKTIVIAVAFGMIGAGSLHAQVTLKKHRPAGYLGIAFNENAETIRVQEVTKDSPAEKAGVKTNDEILRVNGMAATNGKFRALAGTLVQGDTVRLRIERDGKERDITIIAGARPEGYGVSREIIIAPDSVRRLVLRYLDTARVHLDSMKLPDIYISPGDSVFSVRVAPYGRMIRELHMLDDSLVWKRDSTFTRLFTPGSDGVWNIERDVGPGAVFRSIELGARAVGGAEFSEMEPALASYFNGEVGLLTLRVLPETPAERAGLRPGDVVLTAKGRPVHRIAELRSIIGDNTDGVKLEISRKGQKQTLELKPRAR